VSGFTRDTKHYGDRLVYEALDSKWRRYHAHCRCGGHWSDHVEEAGLTVVRRGWGGVFVALVGPGLTEDVDETQLTANVLWEAVTGEPGAQSWFETVKVIDRSEKAEAERKAANDAHYQDLRERSKAAKKAPATESQRRFILALVEQVRPEEFDADVVTVLKGTGIQARRPRERRTTVINRLTKPAASKLIDQLKTRQARPRVDQD